MASKAKIQTYFKEAKPGEWECTCGKTLKQKKGTGNKALSNFCGKPFVGCASHRFHLAMMKFMEGSRDALEKVNSLIVKLKV